MCYNFQSYANLLLEAFVKNFGILYGKHLISHNIHGLYYTASDVTIFGALDNCSSFPFENCMQELKKLLRKNDKPLQQVCRRLVERDNAVRTKQNTKVGLKVQYKQQHGNGPLLESCTDPQYKTLQNMDFQLTSSVKDSFCTLENGAIVKIKNIAFSTLLNEMVIIGKECEKKETCLITRASLQN